jgi:hypothetical protein
MEQKTDTQNSALAWATIGLAAISFPAFAGCHAGTGAPSGATSIPSARLNPAERSATKTDRLEKVVDAGFGIYVFPADNSFAETLADFKQTHPDIKITSITQGPDETHGMADQTYARSNTFIVVTERQ